MSHLEITLAFQMKAKKLPKPEQEFRFHPDRKWRFDFAWPDHKVAVEVEGGVFAGGRHNRGSGFVEDTVKYSAAAELGWCVLRYTEKHILNGEAVQQIERVLAHGDNGTD